jgi:hypothetical protein
LHLFFCIFYFHQPSMWPGAWGRWIWPAISLEGNPHGVVYYFSCKFPRHKQHGNTGAKKNAKTIPKKKKRKKKDTAL